MKRTALRRLTPLRKVNSHRRRTRHAEAFGDKAHWIRSQPCVICGDRHTQAAHVRSRGAGGKADVLVPLCVQHHTEQHTVGIRTFESRHNVDLTLEALDYESRWNWSAA